MPEQRTRRDGNTCRRKRPNYRNRAPIFPFAPRKPPAADRSYPPESAHHGRRWPTIDRKSTRLNSSHGYISYAVFCLKKKKHQRAWTAVVYDAPGLGLGYVVDFYFEFSWRLRCLALDMISVSGSILDDSHQCSQVTW